MPEYSTLLLADAYFGKAVSFRKLGVPVPRGTTTETLNGPAALVRDASASLGIAVVDEPLSLGPFALCHYPKARAGAFVLTAFAVGRLQRFARSGFKRLPSEHLEASLATILA